MCNSVSMKWDGFWKSSLQQIKFMQTPKDVLTAISAVHWKFPLKRFCVFPGMFCSCWITSVSTWVKSNLFWTKMRWVLLVFFFFSPVHFVISELLLYISSGKAEIINLSFHCPSICLIIPIWVWIHGKPVTCCHHLAVALTSQAN